MIWKVTSKPKKKLRIQFLISKDRANQEKAWASIFDLESNEQTKEKAEASIHDSKHNEEPMNPQFDKEK